MVRFGSTLIIIAAIFLFLAYIGLIFDAIYLFPIAITVGLIGSIILIIGVIKERLEEKKEEKEHDYRQY